MLNLLLKLITILRRIYWEIFKPINIGVRIIAVCDDEVMLIKTRYSKFLYLPGGKVKKGESIIKAIHREVEEECKMKLESYKLEGVYFNLQEGKNDHIIIFSTKLSKKITTQETGMEIESINFFPLGSLPINISPGTKRRLEEYNKQSFKNGSW